MQTRATCCSIVNSSTLQSGYLAKCCNSANIYKCNNVNGCGSTAPLAGLMSESSPKMVLCGSGSSCIVIQQKLDSYSSTHICQHRARKGAASYEYCLCGGYVTIHHIYTFAMSVVNICTSKYFCARLDKLDKCIYLSSIILQLIWAHLCNTG